MACGHVFVVRVLLEMPLPPPIHSVPGFRNSRSSTHLSPPVSETKSSLAFAIDFYIVLQRRILGLNLSLGEEGSFIAVSGVVVHPALRAAIFVWDGEAR